MKAIPKSILDTADEGQGFCETLRVDMKMCMHLKAIIFPLSFQSSPIGASANIKTGWSGSCQSSLLFVFQGLTIAGTAALRLQL